MLAWPTVPAPAPPLEAPLVELPSGTQTADQANVRGGALANLTGAPAISAPVGLSSRRPAGRPPARGGLGSRLASPRCGRGARAGERPPLGRGPAAARRARADGRPKAVPGRARLRRCSAMFRRRCARTGTKASERGCTSPTPSRAPPATPGSGTGTPASRRSCGAASTPPVPARSWRACSPSSGRYGFVGHTIFWRSPVSFVRPRLLQRRLPQLAADRDDPAAAARLGVANRRRRSHRGAPDRRSARLAGPRTATSRATGCSGSCSPTSRASTPRPSSNRSGAPGQRPHRLPSPGPPQPPARLRRLDGSASAGGPVLCETLVNTMWSLSLQAYGRPSATPALVERLWDERAGPVRRRGPARRRAGRGRSPGRRWRRSPCPTCPRRSGGGWSRSTCSRRASSRPRSRRPRSRSREPSYEPGWRPRAGPPLLARPDLGQLGLDGLDRDAPARLRGGGRATGRGPVRRGRARRAARVLRPATDRQRGLGAGRI